MTDTPKKTGLALLREPFLPNQISKLPKPTKAQTDAVRNDFKAGIRCELCGAWHHPQVVHLDYVGHAALTDRLLDADPNWNWEYVAVGPDGNPVFDKDGGMWIRLTVCGVTRLGYGDAQEKTGGNATKERIGDALRNAAMRFGAALDLWHKGDLHVSDETETPKAAPKPAPTPMPAKVKAAAKPHAKGTISGDPSEGDLSGIAEPPPATDKPDGATLGQVINAFATKLSMTAPMIEKEYNKPMADWTNADVAEARELFKHLLAERKAMAGDGGEV